MKVIGQTENIIKQAKSIWDIKWQWSGGPMDVEIQARIDSVPPVILTVWQDVDDLYNPIVQLGTNIYSGSGEFMMQAYDFNGFVTLEGAVEWCKTQTRTIAETFLQAITVSESKP